MARPSESRTSVTLLGRVRQNPTDQAAWDEFVERYGRHIYRWCRQWKLQDADAEDVTQDILVKLAQKLRDFAYDPSRSFRAWLRTLTQHAWSDLIEARQRIGSAPVEVLESLEARDDLLARLNEQFDQEILEEALVRVRLRMPAHYWDVFRLMALEGKPGAEVAEQLAIKVATVFRIRSKFQNQLKDEIVRLGSD